MLMSKKGNNDVSKDSPIVSSLRDIANLHITHVLRELHASRVLHAFPLAATVARAFSIARASHLQQISKVFFLLTFHWLRALLRIG